MQTRDENVEDNEGLGRKSSKRCCIFHKQRDFGESSTDSSDNDSDDVKRGVDVMALAVTSPHKFMLSSSCCDFFLCIRFDKK